jgi:hypothetical protein
MWDDNGWVVVSVEQEHIDASMQRDSSHCMVAMAISASIPDARRIAVDLQTIRFSRNGLRYLFLTPRVAQDCIIAFDLGEREKIAPFVLRMRPAQIAKAGKRRHEVPTNGELRGSGLTVAAEQPHLDAEPTPGRYLTDGTRNLDPNRSDGLARPKLKRARRVSSAPRGSVPTTLGGRPPQVSVLARREFGLRILRR